MVVQTRLAAAVLLLRPVDAGFEVFMVRRAIKSAFMPDVYVFPGGTVQAEDRALEKQSKLCRAVKETAPDAEGFTQLGSGVRAAAIRELFEEANILLAYAAGTHQQALLEINREALARFAGYRKQLNLCAGTLEQCLLAEHLVLATDQLCYFAHWITPVTEPRRYDTHFFLVGAPLQQEALHDQLETSDGIWIQPSEALARNAEGTFPLAFPTIHQLRELASYPDCATAFVTTEQRTVATIMPVRVERDGKVDFMLIPEHTSSV